MSDGHSFSANKIFIYLFVYTLIEVLWGTWIENVFGLPRWALWGGLLVCAFLKGYLIFTWFMHMKFEGWIVKGLVVPTVPLVAILIFANMPDTSFNDDLLYPIGHQLEVELRLTNEDADPSADNPYILRSTGQVTGMPDETPGKVVPAGAGHGEKSGH